MSTGIVFMPQVKQSSVRTCNTCKHRTKSNNCGLFGRISLVTGEVYLNPVMHTRIDELCGEEGKYWENNIN